jgi:hypothetical protein
VEPRDRVSHVSALLSHFDGLNEAAITGHAIGHDDHERQDSGRKRDATYRWWRRIGCWHFPRLILARWT